MIGSHQESTSKEESISRGYPPNSEKGSQPSSGARKTKPSTTRGPGSEGDKSMKTRYKYSGDEIRRGTLHLDSQDDEIEALVFGLY